MEDSAQRLRYQGNQTVMFGNQDALKGGTGSGGFGNSAFGSSTQPASTFGTASSGFGTQGNAPAFGTPANTASPVFGSTNAGFGSSTTFGTNPLGGAPASSILGGGSITSGTPNSFGVPAQQQSSSVFGGSTFGGAGQTGSTFGGATQTGSTFSGATQTGSTFGGATQTGSTFGGATQTGSTFGGATQTGSTFGGATQTGSTFGGATQTGSTFGAVTQTGSLFGDVPQQSQSGSSFGSTTQSDSFGGGASKFGGTGPAVQSASSGKINDGSSLFGGSTNTTTTQPSSSLFGGVTSQTATFALPDKNQQQSASAFGGATNTLGSQSSGNTFGNLSGGSVFGGSTQQDTTSIFGGSGQDTPSVFGGAATATAGPSSLFGGSTGDQETSKADTLFGKPRTESKGGVFARASGADQEPGDSEGRGGAGGGGGGGGGAGGVKSRLGIWSNRKGAEGTSQDESLPGRRTLRRPAPGAEGVGLFRKAVGGVEPKVKRLTRRRSSEISTGLDTSHTSEEGDVKDPSKRLIRRTTSVSGSDLSSKVAIVCRGLPSKLNNNLILRKHFNKFGKVTRVCPNPTKQQAIVHFESHEDAKNAKHHGRYLEKGAPPMQIFWSAFERGGRPNITPDKKSAVRTSSRVELDDELQSMAGTADVAFGEVRALDRVREKPRSRSPVTRSPSPNRPRSCSPARPRPQHLSLKALHGTVARTAQERYDILHSCDQVVREALGLHMKTQTDLADAKTLVASCQDMCPEKEIYQRVYQRRVHVYEMIPGSDQIDHARAVKEYSRSSADQELPLPSELRPPEVLDRTMTYLLNNIADDGGDGRWSDWFDFLWNRTRSIRKEITQLQLCDDIVVGLVEKCTRFHIYCSAILCTEDPMVFDEKINNENLTKCLQTLKELYTDMQDKKGLQCPNEAEFRSYMVLMNLNEGDILREVQQLRPEVRDSAELKFVRNIHSAINSNNYIRFFKMVSRAEFLPACIMHRYFGQVRTRALHTMSKAYKSNPLAISELRRLLLFESDQEAYDFCVHHGLQVQEGSVDMDKRAIITPEASFGPTRAINVIESKQHTSVGEAINGGPLPPNDIREPTTCFTEDGRFIAPDLPVSEQDPSKPGTSATSSQQSAPGISLSPKKRPVLLETTETASDDQAAGKLVFTNDVVKEIAKELFIDVIKEMTTNMATTFVKAINVYLDKADPMFEDIFGETITEEARCLASEVLDENRRQLLELQARDRAEKSLSRERACHQITDTLVENGITDEVMQISVEEMRLVEVSLQEQSIKRVTTDVIAALVSEVLEEELEENAGCVYQTDVLDRMEELEETSKAVQLLVQARFFNRWKNRLASRQRLQKSMATFPPAPSMDTMESQLRQILPESEGMTKKYLHMGNSAKLTLLSPASVLENQARLSQSLVLHAYWSGIKREKAWVPLEVVQIVGPPLIRIRKARQTRPTPSSINVERFYWKLLVSLPHCENDPASQEFSDWVAAKLTRGTVKNSKNPTVSKLLSLYKRDINPYNKLGVCIRAVYGVLSDQQREDTYEKERCMNTTNGLLFVLRAMGEDCDEQEYWSCERTRLYVLVEKNTELNIRPALCVFVPYDGYLKPHIEMELGIRALETDGLVTRGDIVMFGEGIIHANATKKFISALHCMAREYHDVHLPTQQALRGFVEDVIHKQFFTVVYQDLAARSKKGKLHQGPEPLLALYNDVVNHMRDVLSDKRLLDIPWPVPEFSATCDDMPGFLWNQSETLWGYGRFVRDLLIPDWEPAEEGESLLSESGCSEDRDWLRAADQVWEYVAAVTEDVKNATPLYSRIGNILQKARRGFEEACWFSVGVGRCDPLRDNMPWTEIIMSCVNFKLSYFINEVPRGGSGELDIYYFPDKLNSYSQPQEWVSATREDNTQQETHDMKDSFVRSAKRKHESTKSSNDSPRYDFTPQAEVSIIMEPESANEIKSKEISHSLDSVVAKERRANEDFEAYLERTLAEGNDLEIVNASLESTNQMPGFTSPPPASYVQQLMDSFQAEETELLKQPLVDNRRRLSAPSSSFYSPGINNRTLSTSSVKKARRKDSHYDDRRSDMYCDEEVNRPRSAEPSFLSCDESRGMMVADKMDLLSNSLNSQRQASRLFEMKLQAFIESENF